MGRKHRGKTVLKRRGMPIGVSTRGGELPPGRVLATGTEDLAICRREMSTMVLLHVSVHASRGARSFVSLVAICEYDTHVVYMRLWTTVVKLLQVYHW